MNQNYWNVVGILLITLLLVLFLLLLIRRKLRARTDIPTQAKVAAAVREDAPHPGIDPAEYADTVDQQAVLDRLSELPQFRRLTDGTLIEWGSGARVTPCDCRLPPEPHLMISWGPKRSQRIVTKNGLAHYVAYQERVANVLLMRPAVGIARHAGPAGAHSRRFPQPKKGR